MYYYRRLDRQKRKLAIPFNYSIRCARADMTVTDIWLLWSLETVAMASVSSASCGTVEDTAHTVGATKLIARP